MLDRESWAHYVEVVPEGGSRRFQHECGGGRTLLVSHDGERYRAWCFRCNDGDALPLPVLSLAELADKVSRSRVADAVCTSVLSLPEPLVDAVDSWPAEARLWLYRAGLGRTEIGKLGAYWHPPTSRVVLPVRNVRGEVVYWQARSVDGRQPKYLGSATDKQTVVAAYGTGFQDRLVICEDILSAFKVGMQFQSVSLLGTSMSSAVAAHAARLNLLTCVWLDSDRPGQIAAAKVARKLRLMGLRVARIKTERDPKLLTHSQISDAVCAAELVT